MAALPEHSFNLLDSSGENSGKNDASNNQESDLMIAPTRQRIHMQKPNAWIG